MDSIDVDGTPFSVVMDRAVKLKTEQTKHLRKKYDEFPSFYANSIFPRDGVVDARKRQFDDRLAAATRMKEDGNAAYREGRLDDALSKYESALSNTNPEWKTEGIKDQFVREHVYECDDEDKTQELNRFLVNCYNNIALVLRKMSKFAVAIRACDCSLAINGRNAKLFYLRTQARIAPKSSGAADLTLARSDLRMALKSNSGNSATRNLLRKLEHQRKLQSQKDKRMGGLFDRDEIYDPRELSKEKAARKKSTEQDQVYAKEQDIVFGESTRQPLRRARHG
ncbi:hypothetical protein ACHAWF_002713 [Thalassiosira exigua]